MTICSVGGVGAERAHSLADVSEFSVRVEQGNVDPSSRLLPDVHLDDPDLGFAEPEKAAQALEDDHVVVDERHPDRCGHVFTLRPSASLTITRSGD